MVMAVLDTKTARDLHKSRLRVAELEARCAAMAEALKPLADIVLNYDEADFVYDPPIASNGVRAVSLFNITLEDVLRARAALAMQTAPPTPGDDGLAFRTCSGDAIP